MSVNFSPCVLIPCYNHGAMMPGVLARLKPFNLPCIVVDDGSDATTQQQLDSLLAEQPGVTLIRLAENAGKGAANANRRCKTLSIITPRVWNITRSSRLSTGLIFSISGNCRKFRTRSKGC